MKLVYNSQKITAEVVNKITTELTKDASIDELDLSCIENTALKQILPTLKTNKSVKKLSLQHAQSRLSALGYYHYHSANYKHADACRNQPALDATLIAELIKANSTLTQIDLSGQNLTVKGLKAIAEALLSNYQITDLHMSTSSSTNADDFVEITLCKQKIQRYLRRNIALLVTRDEEKSLEIRQAFFGAVSLKKLFAKQQANTDLTSLTFDDCEFGENAGESIGNFVSSKPSLTTLRFTNTSLNKTNCEQLATARSNTLTTINLTNSHIKDEGMEALIPLLESEAPITSLNLTGCGISATGFAHVVETLKTHPTLTTLILNDNPLTTAAPLFKDLLATNNKLTRLEIKQINFDEKGVGVITESVVESLTLQVIEFDRMPNAIRSISKRNAYIAGLTGNEQEVNFSDVPWGENAFAALSERFKERDNLKKLILTGGVLNAITIRHCANFVMEQQTLTHLDLSGNPLAAEGITTLVPALNGHPNLVILNLNNTNCGDEGAKCISQLLTVAVDEKAFESLDFKPALPALKVLCLAQNNITTAALSCLKTALQANETILTHLVLNNNPLTTAASLIRELLLTNGMLIHLDLSGIKFDNNAVNTIAFGLDENISLKEIKLDNKPDWMQAVEERNKYTAKLQGSESCIEFKGGYWGRKTFAHLTNIFAENQNFSALFLTSQALHFNTVIHLVGFIQHHLLTLIQLDLSSNPLRADGTKILVGNLKSSRALTELNLSKTECGDEGAKHIGELLKAPVPLAILNVADNKISNAGLQPIAEGLKEHKTLFELKLSNNSISGEGLNFLADCLLDNHSLTKLVLAHPSLPIYRNNGLQYPAADSDELKGEDILRFVIKLDPEQNPELKAAAQKKARRNTSLTSIEMSAHLQHAAKPSGRITKKNPFFRDALDSYLKKNKSKAHDIITAAQAKKLSDVKRLLSTTSLYVLSEEGDGLLHIAVKRSDVESMKFLTEEKNFNRNLLNKAGKTALAIAHENKNDGVVKLLTPISEEDDSNDDEKAASSTTATANSSNASSSRKPKRKREEKSTTEETTSKIPAEKKAKTEFPKPATSASSSASSSSSSKAATSIAASAPHVVSPTAAASSDAKIDERDTRGYTELYLLISTIGSTQETDPIVKQKLVRAYQLIRSGANPSLATFDQDFKVKKFTALHKAVAIGHYRLMKIVLSSPKSDPNARDENNHTPIDWAVRRSNLQMLDRLLIDRRIKPETIAYALRLLKPTSDKAIAMIQLLEKRQRAGFSALQSGINWSQNLSVTFGGSYGKTKKKVVVDSKKDHAYLAMQNLFSQNRLFNDPKDDKGEKDTAGNPVTANLIFIVSARPYQKSNNPERTKICIELSADLTDDGQHHLKVSSSKDEKADVVTNEIQHFLDRVSAVPSTVFTAASDKRVTKPLTTAEIEEQFKKWQENNRDPNFHQTLHHGEQSLFHHLEQIEVINKILDKLMQDPKFTQGCKVYGVVLNIHSPRYVCENCEIAILGSQNSEQSPFLKVLSAQLQLRGCVLPTFSPFKMLTQVSSYKVYPDKRNAVSATEHQATDLDLRSGDNTVILAHDLSAFEQPNLTQYHSTRLKS